MLHNVENAFFFGSMKERCGVASCCTHITGCHLGFSSTMGEAVTIYRSIAVKATLGELMDEIAHELMLRLFGRHGADGIFSGIEDDLDDLLAHKDLVVGTLPLDLLLCTLQNSLCCLLRLGYNLGRERFGFAHGLFNTSAVLLFDMRQALNVVIVYGLGFGEEGIGLFFGLFDAFRARF